MLLELFKNLKKKIRNEISYINLFNPSLIMLIIQENDKMFVKNVLPNPDFYLKLR